MINDPRIQQIRDHAVAWRERFEFLQDQKLTQFATEALDKKTLITCTAFLLEAIKGLRSDMAQIARSLHPEQSDFKYLGPMESDSPLRYADAPRPEISDILVEVCGGLAQNEALIEAFCYAANFQGSKDACRDSPEDNDLIERTLVSISKSPLPKD